MTREKINEVLVSVNKKPFGYFFNFVDISPLIKDHGIVYGIFYGRDEEDQFWETASEIVKGVEKTIQHIPILVMHEQGDFLVPEWAPPGAIQRKNIITRWNSKERLRFVFYQLTFITKPWKEHITKVLHDFADKKANVFYDSVWNNYITYLFSLVPENTSEIAFANELGDNLLKALFENSPKEPLPTPPKKDLEVFYKDYESVIVSGIGSSTTWGLILDQKGVTHLSLHYYGEGNFSVMKEPIDDQ